jgi:hypothetical protein
MDNKLYKDLWINVTQNIESSNNARAQTDREISLLRKETEDIKYTIDIMKACNA